MCWSGQVHVFDISENLVAPLCSQKVARKGHLNRVAFNQRHPILLTGDDRCPPSPSPPLPFIHTLSDPRRLDML